MRLLFLLSTAILAASALAGCGGTVNPPPTTTRPPDNEGAINGLLIDDRYRPIPDATLFLAPVGLTTTSDLAGQFSFAPLEPGPYSLVVNAAGHEAAPRAVDVVGGQYTEVEAQARRIFSDDGTVITTQYAVFIDCAAEAVIYSVIPERPSCTLDTTGDSARSGFETDLGSEAKNVTYVVTEFLFNNAGNYGLVIGRQDSTGNFDTYFAEGDVANGVYKRFQMEPRAIDNRTGETAGRNVRFDLTQPFQTTVFPHAQFYTELHELTRQVGEASGNPVCVGDGGCNGVGVAIGTKAKIVQTTFLGTPPVTVETYVTLKPAGQE